MRQYQLTYGGGQITGRRTAAFEAMAESISGRDLTAFFQTWWYTTGKPRLAREVQPQPRRPDHAGRRRATPRPTRSPVRNTGKVAMPAGDASSPSTLADLLDDATLGTLPAGVTLDGTTLTWTVPATALAATASVAIPVTVNAGTTATRSRPSPARPRSAAPASTARPASPSAPRRSRRRPSRPITGGTPTVGTALTADTDRLGRRARRSPTSGSSTAPRCPAPPARRTRRTSTSSASPSRCKVTGTLAGFNPTSQTSAATAVGVRATPVSADADHLRHARRSAAADGRPRHLAARHGLHLPLARQRHRASPAPPARSTPRPSPARSVRPSTSSSPAPGPATRPQRGPARATAAVAAGDAAQPRRRPPSLSGTPKVGAPFAAGLGAWDDGIDADLPVGGQRHQRHRRRRHRGVHHPDRRPARPDARPSR